MTNLSDGTTTVTPDLVLGYKTATESRNVIHRIIGRAAPDVSLSADTLRRGTLETYFTLEADAWEALTMHQVAGVFTLTDDDVPVLNMTYVRDGAMAISLDPDTLTRWLLSIGYQEVSP